MRKINTALTCFFLLLFTFCSQPERAPEEVRVRVAIDPETLSPVSYSNAGALQIINLLFQSLLSTDLGTNEIKPFLAESMPTVERQDSITLFTYTIRKEAEWTNGSPITAEDVAFTLKVAKAPLLNNESLKSQLEFIQDIRMAADNPRRFTFVCSGYAPEMELLTGDFFILPAYLYDPENLLHHIDVADLSGDLSELENDEKLKAFAAKYNSPDFGRDPKLLQGSGGYTLENWENGQYLTLTRKKDWWGNNTSNTQHLTAIPQRVSFQVIPDITTALLALKNRQLDVLEGIPAAEFEQLQQQESFLNDYALHTPDAYEFVYAGINTRKPKFSDKRTRQAIAHLLDIESVIKVSQQNYATPTVGPIPPSVSSFYNTGLTPYSFNAEKAASLLKASGWVKEQDGWHKTINGKKEKLSINVMYRAGSTSYENAAMILQQNAGKIGIPVQVQGVESSLLAQRSKQHEFDMFFRSLGGNPFAFNFKPLLHTDYAEQGGLNYTGFGTAESDQILDRISNTVNSRQEMAKLLKRLQEIMYEEAAFISMYYIKERIAIHRRFSNTKVSGLKPNYDVSAFTLKEEE
ncbi:ABC transporter substrate-binding protein [Pontibacter anaerobius]|uniref:ABC transporter substrate-binding protein n=1 Tax=Pontibacter anaerobius TaxID=2993940 RepID=A0ABT3RHP9_9BACT|nr:ABC transporter substrate-binding protein [Pontibacter anaerobius]MCX2740770.1 ABC transporter substrate-binding protein [Pontibacter anaerobius]